MEATVIPVTAGGQAGVPCRGTGVRVLFRHRGFAVGLVIAGVIVLLAAAAPLVARHDPFEQDLLNRRAPPVWHQWLWNDAKATTGHILGTDKLGRDYLARLLYGARISLLIGVSTVVISGVIGTTAGVVAGYFGGRVDVMVSFLLTTRLATPVVLVALAVVALHGSSLRTVIAVLGLLLWDRFTVVMRTATQQARALDYVAAAAATGCSTARIVVRHVLPNVASPLVVVATVEMAVAILLEASLSFLGLGVPSPLPSWGLMLAEAKEEIFFAPWMITIPGVALFVLLLSINLIGDGIRDVAAPRR